MTSLRRLLTFLTNNIPLSSSIIPSNIDQHEINMKVLEYGRMKPKSIPVTRSLDDADLPWRFIEFKRIRIVIKNEYSKIYSLWKLQLQLHRNLERRKSKLGRRFYSFIKIYRLWKRKLVYLSAVFDVKNGSHMNILANGI